VALLCEIQQVYQPLSGSNQVKAVAITNQFKALLFANVRVKHLVSEYAAMLFVTPNHLNKTVKQITGKSPGKWIDETLVLEAKVLLFQTDYTVAQIAAEISIADASYFSRLFKKYEGVTPMAFRKMIEKS
jgi:AraC-like DNA-binding protein